MLETITLFESNVDDFTEDQNVKIRGKIIKEQYFKQNKFDRVLQEINDFERKYGEAPKWVQEMR